jgi:CheY-like chemotaxis protein
MLTAVQLMQLRAGGALQMERTIIERQLNHMVRLVNDLLDVSRIARGKVGIQTAPVELATVVADAIELASPLLEELAHNLVVAVPASGLVVDADPTRLSQVVANLLSNAAKYTPANGLITISAEVSDGRVRLSVRDTGAGIEPDFLPRIFDLFVQGGQASDRAQGGLGLGLAIARNLVEMHGGTLSAESDGLGKGSTFTVELALAKSNEGAPSRRSIAMPENGSSRKVLIVDDNTDAAEVLAEALKAVGHIVRVAHDGPSALPVAEQFWPEVALLDVGLPVMDGYELGRRLRSIVGSQLKIVAVTGYGTSAYRHRSQEEGFDEHLVKPVELGQLQILIRDLFA